MKKTLLLSVVASTMIMAGGDIAPVEPIVETPVVAVTSGWDFSGQAVTYYQTRDNAATQGHAAHDLFEKAASQADAGLQLRAVNKNIAYGIGAGVEVSGLTTLGLEHKVVSGVMEAFGTDLKGGWISQAYLTYGIANTSLKLGRQELPKTLSPFAFSEGWNVFKNTFDAALVVNTDISDTTLVGAWVHAANAKKYKDMSDFAHLNSNDGIYMLTAQNKSIDGLTLTGSYYYAPDMLTKTSTEDTNILWGDAKFAISDFTIGLQGGTIIGADDAGLGKDTVAFGGKAGANFGIFDTSVAYSSVDEGAVPLVNRGTLVKTPLYTQMILNQGVISTDADYIKATAGVKALGGKFGVAYGYAINNEDDIVGGKDNNPYEVDVTYKTKVFSDTTTLFAGYVLTDADDKNVNDGDTQNLIRVWGRYNF